MAALTWLWVILLVLGFLALYALIVFLTAYALVEMYKPKDDE